MVRLRIALVSEYYYPDVGGIPEHMHQLGRHLMARGHEVVLITTRFPDVRLGPNSPAVQCSALRALHGRANVDAPSVTAGTAAIEVVRLGTACPPIITNGSVSRAAIGLRLGRQVRALLQRRRFDVIHVHGPLFPVLPLLAIRHAPPGAALVATLHSHFPDAPIMRWLRRPLQGYLDALDRVIAVSDSAIESLRRLGLLLRAEIIPNGVDLAYWQDGHERAELRAPIAGVAPVNVLVQARLEPRNHVAALIDAIVELRRAGLPLRLLVVGDGPLRGALHRRVPAELSGAVLFAGTRIHDRNHYTKSADIYCLTAEIASHPMSLLEGMAAGLPILCHDIDGARQLVDDGVEGLRVPLCDPPALRAALSRLCTDPSLRRRMGLCARRRAAAFSWSTISARVEAQYRGAVQALRSQAPTLRPPADSLCSTVGS